MSQIKQGSAIAEGFSQGQFPGASLVREEGLRFPGAEGSSGQQELIFPDHCSERWWASPGDGSHSGDGSARQDHLGWRAVGGLICLGPF